MLQMSSFTGDNSHDKFLPSLILFQLAFPLPYQSSSLILICSSVLTTTSNTHTQSPWTSQTSFIHSPLTYQPSTQHCIWRTLPAWCALGIEKPEVWVDSGTCLAGAVHSPYSVFAYILAGRVWRYELAKVCFPCVGLFIYFLVCIFCMFASPGDAWVRVSAILIIV